MTPAAISLVVLAGVVSAVLTTMMRRYSASRSILDQPNHRSAHTAPMPRGGGVAIVAAVLSAVTIACLAGWVQPRLCAALVGGGLLVAAIGWVDDLRGASVRLRLLVHAVAAAWALAWLGGLPDLRVGEGVVGLGWLGTALALLGVVWATNLYNFMDGVDGFAGTEALMAAGVGGILLAGVGAWQLALVCFIVAAASAGFLVWNWPPAKIFMGDVGSGFLGHTLAVIAIASERASDISLLTWLIVLGVFVFDATVTLFRRLGRGDPLFAAHAQHAYQRLVARTRSHASATAGLIAMNLLLATIAAWYTVRPQHALPVMLTALAMLLAAYLFVELFAAPAPTRERDEGRS